MNVQKDAIIGGNKPLFDLLPPRSILVVDRLGRSGRSKHPIAGHYMPRIKAAANARGIGYMCLPPHGALLNPIEVLWDVSKARVLDKQPPGNPEDAWEQIIRGPRFLSEFMPMFEEVVLQMQKEPALFRSAIHRRAEGCDLMRFLKDNKVAEAVLAERAVRPQRRPMDFEAVAFRKRLLNIHAGENEKLTTKAQLRGYARYVVAHLHAGIAEGLSFPAAAGKTGADGWEDHCRVCQGKAPPKPKGAAASPPDHLLCCEAAGCTASYHWWCLGLRGVPEGRWECLKCANGSSMAGPSAKVPGAEPGTRFTQSDGSDDWWEGDDAEE